MGHLLKDDKDIDLSKLKPLDVPHPHAMRAIDHESDLPLNHGPGSEPEQRAVFRILRAENKRGGEEGSIPVGVDCVSNGAIYVINGVPMIGLHVPREHRSECGLFIGITVDAIRPLNEAARAMLAVLR